MTKYYFTLDSDYTIAENANINFVEAESEKEARALILAEISECFESFLEEEGGSLDIEEGSFGDCWFKAYGYNTAEIADFEAAPFSQSQSLEEQGVIQTSARPNL